jgi:hypothetical protein
LASSVGVDPPPVGAMATSILAAVAALAEIGRRENEQAGGRIRVAGLTRVHRDAVGLENRWVVRSPGVQTARVSRHGAVADALGVAVT